MVKLSNKQGRLDKVLTSELTDLSRTNIKQLIQDGHVLVNNQVSKASYQVKLEDIIHCEIPENKDLEIEAQDIPLDIVYEDKDIIVVNKPSGMIVHPGPGIVKDTLVNALLYHCQDLSGINGITRPGIVHRIDKDTSGLLMVAKSDLAHKELSEQLKEHTVKRKYLALVHGEIPHQYGKVDMPIGRDTNDRQKMVVTKNNSKKAITHFTVIEHFKNYTLIECRLETGRTHQIRVHMAHIGYPVYGDPKYGYRKDDQSHGQYLHAESLGFIHPRSKEFLEFTRPVPDYMQEMIERLRREKDE